MDILKKTAVGIVTGLLILTPYATASAFLHNGQDPQRAMTAVTIPCQHLSWEAANKLPWFITPSDVECMMPTQDDLQASTQARSLLATAAAQVHSDSAQSDSVDEYEQGVAAYAAGRYIEAIGHFQASIGTANP